MSPLNEVAAFLARRPSIDELAQFHLSDAAEATLRTLLEKQQGGRGALNAAEQQVFDELTAMRDLADALRSRVQPRVRSSAPERPAVSGKGGRAASTAGGPIRCAAVSHVGKWSDRVPSPYPAIRDVP